MVAVMEKVVPAATVMDDVRFPAAVIDGLLQGALHELGDVRVAERLKQVKDFHTLAVRMTQDLLIAVSLAQSLSPGAPFGMMMPHSPFSSHDKDLRELGHAMFRKMVSLDRLPDSDIPDALLKERFEKVQLAI